MNNHETITTPRGGTFHLWHQQRRERCSYADQYQGKRAPTCGCKACETIWNQAKKEN
jgi:hypothetical protein